jgi:hypothetical protein
MDEGASNYRRTHRRATVRELAAGIVTSIVAVTLYGSLTPATVRTGSADYESIRAATDSWSVTFPMVVVVLGSFYLSTLFWAVVIEHRRPWPFGPRPPIPNPFWRESVVSALAAWIAVAVAGAIWETTRLYDLDDDRFVWAASPAAYAAQAVAFFAAMGLSFVLISLLAVGLAGRHTAAPEVMPQH